ncbi:hypothetical protein [Macromonas bipunctata]|uniref:hypothetical protein n=1 Tax=Macromonas bipunctata TaxID=183670 RepID=UPI0014750677|nr:hypothetical protein [Macromonas bipunctata]
MPLPSVRRTTSANCWVRCWVSFHWGGQGLARALQCRHRFLQAAELAQQLVGQAAHAHGVVHGLVAAQQGAGALGAHQVGGVLQQHQAFGHHVHPEVGGGLRIEQQLGGLAIEREQAVQQIQRLLVLQHGLQPLAAGPVGLRQLLQHTAQLGPAFGQCQLRAGLHLGVQRVHGLGQLLACLVALCARCRVARQRDAGVRAVLVQRLRHRRDALHHRHALQLQQRQLALLPLAADEHGPHHHQQRQQQRGGHAQHFQRHGHAPHQGNTGGQQARGRGCRTHRPRILQGATGPQALTCSCCGFTPISAGPPACVRLPGCNQIDQK